MYINNGVNKSKKGKWFLFFFIVLLVTNFLYLEYEISQYKNITSEYKVLNVDYENIIAENIQDMKRLSKIINSNVIRIEEYEKIFEKEKIARLKVHVTTYNAVIGQTDDTPDITAYGKKVRIGVTFAASNDLISKFRLKRGMKMYIPGIPSSAKDGMWVFGDKMHPRWNNRVDLLIKGSFQTSRKYMVYIFI